MSGGDVFADTAQFVGHAKMRSRLAMLPPSTTHGPVGTVKDITAWREYFEKLRAQVAAGIKAGQTLEQMQKEIKMAEYS